MTVLNTPRLRLRKPTDADRAGGVGFLMSHRSRFMGGPYGADAARADWDMVCSMWAKCGFGLLVLTVTNDDRALGLAGPFMPEGHPEPELAWNLWDAATEGKGLATEAAISARDWAFAICRFPTMVSYIHPEIGRAHV